MADDVVRVCPGHPRASPTSQTCLADLQRESSTVTVEVTRSSIRAAEVVVNHMIRLPWVLFNGSAAGKGPRESRSGLYILGEEWYNRLLESV